MTRQSTIDKLIEMLLSSMADAFRIQTGKFYLAFSPHLCYHMEKHYISGMSDSKAASAASIILLHSGKSQCF